MRSNWFARRKYQTLLLTLTLLLFAYPVLRGPAHLPVVARILLTAVFLASTWVAVEGGRLRLLALVLCVPALLGPWTGYALPEEHDRTATAFFHSASLLFLAFIFFILLSRVYRAPTVTADGVAAALCGYLIMGSTFGHAYSLVELAVPGSFKGLGAGTDLTQTHFLLTYFSFTTLTTVGYGDITPDSDTARALGAVEGVAGQFYLAVLVAELVGKRVAQALSEGAPQPNQIANPPQPAEAEDSAKGGRVF